MTLMLLLSHILGDYFFQTDWMAQNKVKNTLDGWEACIIHCLIYTWTVVTGIAISCNITSFTVFGLMSLMVFITHFPIDKFSLAKYLMKWKGNDLSTFNTNPFMPIVYIAIDNGSHLILMALGFHYLFGINFC
jgi:hypothetical protein